MILAIDPGLSLGWCRSSDCRGGVLNLAKYEDYGEAVSAFTDWLDAVLTPPQRPQLLIIERTWHTPFRKRSAVSDLTEWLVGAAHAVAWSRCVERHERPANEARKFLTGNGKAKDDTVIAALHTLGFFPRTPHEADAAALICLVQNRRVAA